MITKDINGNTLPASYDTVVATAPRDWQARLYADGVLLDCAIVSLNITKGSCGTTESFSLGNVISNMLTAELKELSVDIKNKDIEVQIALDTGSLTWITVGHFIAVDVVKTIYQTTVTGYGFTTAKTGGSFTIPSTPTLASLASAIATAIATATGCGCSVTFDADIDTSLAIVGSLESGMSCYKGLQVLAHLVGGYVCDTNDGNIAIHQYSSTPTATITSDRMVTLPDIEESAFTITGVQVTATGQYQYVLTTDTTVNPDKTYYIYSDGEYVEVEDPVDEDINTYYEQEEIVYSYGSPIVLYDENPNMSGAIFNNIYRNIVGYSFYTGTANITLGDPRIEGSDTLSVVDALGTAYTVPCHKVEHKYDGGLSSSVSSVKATDDGTFSVAPITQQIDQISTSANIARASAESAKADAESAKQSAQTAFDLATQVETLAQQAQDDAETASASANSAVSSANVALDQLGIVENVVGVLDLLTKNGDYQVTTDEEVIPDKWYFKKMDNGGYEVVNAPTSVYHLTEDTAIDSTKAYYERTGTGTEEDPYVYTEVASPVVADIGTYYEKYYELVGIDEAIQNYVSSQLVVDSEGLWLKRPDSTGIQSKVLLSSTDGVVLYGTDGNIVGKYGQTAQIGDLNGLHIEMDGTELGFYQGENKVAYIRNNQLFIEQSVVVKQMDVGLPFGQINPATGETGLGQWSWKVHPNSENPSRNNLNLKWIG